MLSPNKVPTWLKLVGDRCVSTQEPLYLPDRFESPRPQTLAPHPRVDFANYVRLIWSFLLRPRGRHLFIPNPAIYLPEKFLKFPYRPASTPRDIQYYSSPVLQSALLCTNLPCPIIAPILQSLCSPATAGRPLDQLHADLGMPDEAPNDAMHSICDPELPEAGEIWDGVVEKSGEWLDQVRGAM